MAALAATVAFLMPQFASVLLGPRFAASSQYIGWFALAFLFSGMYYMVTNYIFYAERTRYLAAVTMSVALLNIPLTYFFIKVNGGVGAAQAMAISMALSFFLTWFVSQRVFPMPWFGDRRRGSRP
jgi:O-antigen/teichoic acid export membrane protein